MSNFQALFHLERKAILCLILRSGSLSNPITMNMFNYGRENTGAIDSITPQKPFLQLVTNHRLSLIVIEITP